MKYFILFEILFLTAPSLPIIFDLIIKKYELFFNSKIKLFFLSYVFIFTLWIILNYLQISFFNDFFDWIVYILFILGFIFFTTFATQNKEKIQLFLLTIYLLGCIPLLFLSTVGFLGLIFISFELDDIKIASNNDYIIKITTSGNATTEYDEENTRKVLKWFIFEKTISSNTIIK